MKKERSFTYLTKDKQKKAVCAQHPHIFMTLMALAMMILAPQGASARELGPWDFLTMAHACGNTSQTSGGVVPQSTTRYSAITNGYVCSTATYGGVQYDLSRFAFRSANDRGWYFYDGGNNGCGLLYGNGTPEFAILDLRPDDVVKITFRGVGNNTVSLTFKSGNAKQGGTTLSDGSIMATASNRTEAVAEFTITDKCDVIFSHTGAKYQTIISYISIERPDVGSYNYSPTNYEVYDFYSWNGTNIQSNNLVNAGFKLDWDYYDANYLTGLSTGVALNNRLAISQVQYNGTYTPWQFANEGLKSIGNWHNFSICNLNDGDRVRITYFGQAKFSSRAENSEYNGVAAYKDTWNDGVFNEEEGDVNISLGMSVEAAESRTDGTNGETIHVSYYYVIQGNGHLDIALSTDSRLCKIEIYSDHPAVMEDRYNGSADLGYTAYFDATGQLQGKEHIMEGGLEIHIGNEDALQHAIVTMSDKGPVSFVYDQAEYKMARQEDNSTSVMNKLPTTGTYYKFIPKVKGTMTVRFKAASVRYYDYFIKGTDEVWRNGWVANQYTTNAQCPYYLMEQTGQNSFTQKSSISRYNGADGQFTNISVEVGRTYYLYGWWANTSDFTNSDAGIAQLLDVTFVPDNMVYPLAKTVKNGTTSDDDLAHVSAGTTTANLHIKKMSDNIQSCEPYVEGGKLKIKNIVFKEGKNQGGVILIKVGSPTNYDDPLFALTIAYSASWNNGEGHKWDFSDQPLRGLQWNNTSGEADITPFGTYYTNFFTDGTSSDTDQNSLLYKEMHRGWNADGSEKSDWRFTYRVEKGDKKQDPMFLNKYGMEGDNADMMWDTEGLIFSTSSNQSCIFNEFKNASTQDFIDHEDQTNRKDPDRFVGVMPGGEFRIPNLMKDDRVIIYMGSAKSSGTDALYFNIENAYDAVHTLIDPNDTYKVGGSVWNADSERTEQSHGDPYYRGCYHFFATGDQEHEGEPADMIFKLENRGSLAKLYSIEIYHDGTHHYTNSILHDNSHYDLWNNNINGNLTVGANGDSNQLTIHFRGKGEEIAKNADNVKNEVITYTGKISNFTLNTVNGGAFSYTSKVGDFGTMMVRAKVMDFNHKYVTDFGDRNLTIGYLEKMDYPYTWDFTDIQSFSGDDLEAENDALPNTKYVNGDDRAYWEDPKIWNLSLWEKDEENMIDGEPVYRMNVYTPNCNQDGAETNAYYLFANNKTGGGNQLHANGKIIPETQGLLFYMDNNDKRYNGNMWIAKDGLHLVNNSNQDWWNYKTVVPKVPAGAAVYLRVARDRNAVPDDAKDAEGDSFIYKKYRFTSHMPVGHYSDTGKAVDIKYEIGATTTEYASSVGDWTYDETYNQYSKYFEAEDGSGDYIIAIKNWGEESDLHLTLNGYVLKKLGVSLDEKKIGTTGYATESRGRVIDHRLTSFFTGKPVEAYIGKMNSDHTLLKLTQIDIMDKDNDPNNPADASHLGKGCILYNNAGESVKDKTVSVFDDGTFNLFVPDMHLKDEDTQNTTSSNGSYVFSTNFAQDNDLKACVPVIHLDNNSTSFTRYILSAQPYKYQEGEDDGGSASGRPKTEDGKLIGFYRVNPKTGSNMKGNQAYIEVSNSATARVDITFDMFEDIDDGVATKVEGVENAGEGNGSYMTISGQRVNTPAQSGIYIKNGKKIVVK